LQECFQDVFDWISKMVRFALLFNKFYHLFNVS